MDIKLYIKKLEYELKFSSNLSSLKFDCELYKKVRFVVFFTIVLGGFFAWSSACEPTKESVGSNIYVFFNNVFPGVSYNTIFHLTIMGLLMVNLISIIPSVKASFSKHHVEKFGSTYFQKSLFRKYVICKVSGNLIVGKIEFTEQLRVYKENKDDIIFKQSDFEEFCNNYFKKYRKQLPNDFIENLSHLTLLKECIEETLVYEEDKDMYTFIGLQNDEVLRSIVGELG